REARPGPDRAGTAVRRDPRHLRRNPCDGRTKTPVTTPGSGGGLADTLNILLDKGLVIDASVKVSVIGIELLAIEARIVIACVDTYIRYLEAMQRLDAQAK